MKMVLIKRNVVIMKEFDSKWVNTSVLNKSGLERFKKRKRLVKYSNSVLGYKHQLELKGFKPYE